MNLQKYCRKVLHILFGRGLNNIAKLKNARKAMNRIRGKYYNLSMWIGFDLPWQSIWRHSFL